MKTQQLLIVLTVVNFAMLGFSLSRTDAAGAQGVAPILRGRALEIVDESGRVRASITVFPANPGAAMPDGTRGYPETVQLQQHLGTIVSGEEGRRSAVKRSTNNDNRVARASVDVDNIHALTRTMRFTQRNYSGGG